MNKAVSILLLLLLIGMFPSHIPISSASSSKIKIVVSIQSLGAIVKDVLGNYVDVIYILPEGAEPHNYQIPPDKISMFSNASLFVFTGHFAFEETIMNAYPNKNVLTLNKSSLTYGGYKITLLTMPKASGYNPHGYWIYPDNALSIAKAVVDKVSSLDPVHKAIYESNLILFEEKIISLKNMYKYISREYGLSGKPVVIGFPAEQYFVAPLNMNIVAVVVKGEGLTISGNELESAHEALLESNKPLIIASDISRTLSVSNVFEDLESDTGAKIAFVSIVDTNIDSYIGMMYYNLGIVSSTLSSMKYTSSKSSSNINYALVILSITLLLLLVIEGIYIMRVREV